MSDRSRLRVEPRPFVAKVGVAAGHNRELSGARESGAKDFVEFAEARPFDGIFRPPPLSPEFQAQPNAEGVSPLRRRAIDAFDAELGRKGYSKYGASHQEAAEIALALKGSSSLGSLSEVEAKYLVAASLERWRGKVTDYSAIAALGFEARRDPALAIVAETYAEKAVELRGSPKDRALAATLATEAIFIARAPGLIEKPGEDGGKRHSLIAKLGEEGARDLVLALALQSASLDHGRPLTGYSAPIEQRIAAAELLLAAVVGTDPPSAASSAIVDTIFATLPGGAYRGPLADNMARALAHHWHPDDPELARATAARFAELFRLPQGRELLLNDALSLEARLSNLDLVKSDPRWNADLFRETPHIYDNPTLVFALATPTAKQYRDLRGDEARTLSGSHLENTVGYAMNLQPTEHEVDEAEVAAGRQPYYSDESLLMLTAAIRDVGGPDPRVTVLPIQYSSAGTGNVTLPLFRVQDKTTGADKFVDNLGRKYSSFEDWKQNNHLPPGNMVYPENGHLSEVLDLRSSNTPPTIDTAGEYAAVTIDHAALAGGLIAGGAVLAGSGGTLAPFVFGGAAAWGVFRGSEVLVDRHQHGQSIDPLEDAQARAAWIGIGANALSFVSLGATGVAGKLVQTGHRLAFPAAAAAGYLRAGANALDLAAAGDAGHTLIAHWDELPNRDRASLLLSVGFWGVSTYAGTKSTGAKPTEMFDARAMRNAILFQNLDPRVRAVVEQQMSQNPGAGERALADFILSPLFRSIPTDQQAAFIQQHHAAIIELSKTPAYAKLPPGGRRQLLENWSNLEPAFRAPFLAAFSKLDFVGKRVLLDLTGSPGFRELEAADQELLLRYVGGTNPEISVPARRLLRLTLDRDRYRSGTPKEQAGSLSQFLEDQTAASWVVQRSGDAFTQLAPAKVSAGKPVSSYDFYSGPAPAAYYQLEVDGRKIDVFVSAGAPPQGLAQHSLDEVVNAVRALPPEVRATIKRVLVDSRASPDDAFWAGEYKDPNLRAYMSADSDNSTVNIFPRAPSAPGDIVGSMAHEAGHIKSIRAWGHDDKYGPTWRPWRNAIAADRIDASRYARKSPAEDFAETYRLYYQVRGTAREAEVRALMPERFRLLEQLLKTP